MAACRGCKEKIPRGEQRIVALAHDDRFNLDYKAQIHWKKECLNKALQRQTLHFKLPPFQHQISFPISFN
jgi:hypothetical protein